MDPRETAPIWGELDEMTEIPEPDPDEAPSPPSSDVSVLVEFSEVGYAAILARAEKNGIDVPSMIEALVCWALQEIERQDKIASDARGRLTAQPPQPRR